MIVPWILCGIFMIINVALIVKIRLLQLSMVEIRTELKERIELDTNTLITISSGDRYARQLAADMNTQLRILRKERLKYQNGDRELKEAVTNISHDLRTPLTAICGYLELLEREEHSELIHRYLSMIKNRTEVLRKLTEELLRYSIIVSLQEGRKEVVILNHVLEESIISFYGALKERKIEPDITIPEQPVERILDLISLRRIFDNVMSNIIKYSDGDLQVIMTENGTISFINSAGNLNSVMVGRLFDRFYTVENGGNSTGLGLSIAKLLMERMSGIITSDYRNEKLSITLTFPKVD